MGAGRATWSRIFNQWSHHPVVDIFLAGFGVLCLAVLQRHHILALHEQEQRMNIYGAVASVAAIVGGFGTAAISQYASSSGARMAILRQMFGVHLRRNWVGLLTSMLTVSGGCLAVMVSDTDKTLGWTGWVVEFLLLFGGFRSLRLVWLFRMLIDVSDHDAGNINQDSTVEVLDIHGDT